MKKNEYTDFIKRYSMLNSPDKSPGIEKMIDLQNAVFTTASKTDIGNLWEARIASKIKRQKEFARLANIQETT